MYIQLSASNASTALSSNQGFLALSLSQPDISFCYLPSSLNFSSWLLTLLLEHTISPFILILRFRSFIRLCASVHFLSV